jgi:hypothetical protein
MDFDAGTTPPKGVASPSRLSVYVGDPPRELLIFTGVATPEFKSDDDDLVRDVAHIRLGAITTEDMTWTAEAALASISNEDSDFIFATDSVTVDRDADGVLRLNVEMAVQGDPSKLHRISYTVHVLSDVIQAKISGQIRWRRSFGDPSHSVLGGKFQMFRVDIGESVTSIGPNGFATIAFVSQNHGFSTRPVLSGDTWAAAYEINDVPLGKRWEVRPTLLGVALLGPPQGFDHNPGFHPFPQLVELSLAHPAAAGVDFTMDFMQGPR